jgi:hypothetical protein
MPKQNGKRFSDHFGIKRDQSQLDFVDIPLHTDIALYVDPYALHVSSVDWLRKCGDLVANYFQLLIEAIRAGDQGRAMRLLSNLKEPNETRLGQSRGRASGRGWGPKQALTLYQTLSKSAAVASGRLRDLSDFELLIPGIGSDKISDLTVNVIRGELVTYTQEQCEFYGVPMENVPAGVYWNPDDERWEAHYAPLPVYEGSGVLLVPKIAVRRRLVPDYQEFYDRYVLPFLEAEHLNARDGLVHTLKNGNPKVFKEDLRAKYEISKEFLFNFSEKNPAVLEKYKSTLPDKAASVIQPTAIESKQTENRMIDREARITELRQMPTGASSASSYQDFVFGALADIFYPELTRPKKEQKADEGRKRIDVFFTNSAAKGFFSRLINAHDYHAPYISVECKNYSEDLANPDFDQLLGRLNRKRGYVGLLFCRKNNDRGLILKRCRDVVHNDELRLIIVLEDNDLQQLLIFAANRDTKRIDEYLEEKLKEILL